MFPLTLFFYGFLAGCAGLLLQVLLLSIFGEQTSFLNPTLLLLFAAALIEEGAKLAFLFQAQRRFGEGSLALLSLFGFGLGFALTELSLALMLSPQDLPSFMLLGSNIVIHILTVLILGLALRRYTSSRPTLLGVLIALSALHALYNLLRL